MAVLGETLESLVVLVIARTLINNWILPFKAVRVERAQDQAGGARNRARFVHILDSHEPGAKLRASIGVAGHGREQRAEV